MEVLRNVCVLNNGTAASIERLLSLVVIDNIFR